MVRSSPGSAPAGLWLIVQLFPLLLAAFRIPLWARPQLPAERYALQMMVVAQVVGASLIFPFLLRDWRCAVVIVLTSAPFVQLAAFLTDAPEGAGLEAIALVWTWLISLGFWSIALRRREAQMAGVALATTLSVGTPFVAYLRMEFASAPGFPSRAVVWMALAALLGSSILAAGLSRRSGASSYPQS